MASTQETFALEVDEIRCHECLPINDATTTSEIHKSNLHLYQEEIDEVSIDRLPVNTTIDSIKVTMEIHVQPAPAKPKVQLRVDLTLVEQLPMEEQAAISTTTTSKIQTKLSKDKRSMWFNTPIHVELHGLHDYYTNITTAYTDISPIAAKVKDLFFFNDSWPPDFVLFPGRATAPPSAPD
jgi:hypothetical protein